MNGQNILIVDDILDNLQVLTAMLEKRGYVVRPVRSGAMALMTARSNPPDLILLDINMPGMDGYEVCKKLREDEDLNRIPVIFLTAMTEPIDKARAFSLGGVDYITKPFELEEVEARIKTHLTIVEQGRRLLEIAEEKYQSVFGSTIEGFFQETPDGHFITANPGFVRMCGYATYQELLENVTDTEKQLFAEPADRSRFVKTLEKEGFVHNLETEVCRKDGAALWVSVRARAVRDANEGIVRHECIVDDISKRKMLEAQLLQAQKMEAIGTLAGGIVHDFSNILSLITGYASLLRLDIGKDTQQSLNYIGQILDASDKAGRIMRNLLIFSKKQLVELKSCPINSLVSGVEKLLRRLIPENIEFIIVFSEDDLNILADSAQIDQVLLNLVLNARDAMQGGGKLAIRTRRIELDDIFVKSHGFGRPGIFALVSVSDTGSGMDEETKSRIFEPFFTTKGKGKGTGLGLAIVYGVVTKHNGFISVGSEPGQGTTFDIYLPSSDVGVEDTKLKYEEARGGKETILVAEDNDNLRVFIAEVLTRMGYNVVQAIDGNDAIDKYTAHCDVVSLVILDVVMPGKNGKQVYARIRKARRDAKALFISGYVGDTVLEKDISSGKVNFLRKPISPGDLLRVVRRILDGKV